MKKGIRKIFTITLSLAALFSSACLKDTPSTDLNNTSQTILQIEYPPAAQYFGFGSGLEYFAGGQLSYQPADLSDTATVYVNIDGNHTLSTGLTLSIGPAGSSHLEDNYANDSVIYVSMPDSDYSIIPASATIPAGLRLDTFQVIFYPGKIDPTKNYMLPLTITSAGGYPVSANFGIIYFHTIAAPPSPSLRFFAAMDGSDMDSIRGNYGVDSNVTYVAGVSGKAAQFSNNGYISYPSANDFGNATSFTISFWMNITLAQKDNAHAEGILAVSSASNFWSEACFYADNTTGGNSDSMDLKIHFANGTGDNWDFVGYTGANRWPNMYDGNWHHVAFTYNAPSQTGTVYRDGVQFDQKTNETIVFDGHASRLIVGGYQEVVNIVDTYADNPWMSGFPGAIDQIRLYNVALSASDIAALYAKKQ